MLTDACASLGVEFRGISTILRPRAPADPAAAPQRSRFQRRRRPEHQRRPSTAARSTASLAHAARMNTRYQCVAALPGHRNCVYCAAAVGPDCVVSGGFFFGDPAVKLQVWNTKTGERVRTLNGHSKWITCVAALPGNRIISGSDDETLRVWDLTDGRCLQLLHEHSDHVTCVVIRRPRCFRVEERRPWSRRLSQVMGLYRRPLRTHSCPGRLVGAVRRRHVR
mmetsp:Transcript_22506/g.70536  ORF Transcript_22506/g.70536 Transcript_22506/m.70536 type:complete len:223 (+) Transcript_22506:1149-1817(+)